MSGGLFLCLSACKLDCLSLPLLAVSRSLCLSVSLSLCFSTPTALFLTVSCTHAHARKHTHTHTHTHTLSRRQPAARCEPGGTDTTQPSSVCTQLWTRPVDLLCATRTARVHLETVGLGGNCAQLCSAVALGTIQLVTIPRLSLPHRHQNLRES